MRAGGKILIIDDNDEFRGAVKQALASKGFDVVEAANGEQGFALFESDRPDAAVVDLDMPRVNGLEFTRRAKRVSPGFPVLMITGYAEYYSDAEIISAGINAFLQKPVEIGRVVKAVEAL